KYTPVRPTPKLNVPSGNEHAPAVVDACFEQGCMSTRSLAPAARMFGLAGSTASAGSFWAFCGCEPVGLPTVTRAPVPVAGPAAAGAWAVGLPGWATANAGAGAHASLPATAMTRIRDLFRPFIEPP